MDSHKQSSGVQGLIERLRQEGIADGQNRANELVKEAGERASRIVATAEQEAEAIRAKAKAEAEQYRKNAEDSMAIAARDTVLELKNSLTSRFSRRVTEMVGDTLKDEEFLRKVILEIASKVRAEINDDEQLELLLPADVVGLDELRRNPEKVKQGSLGEFVLSTAREMFRDGVTIKQGTHQQGIQINLVKQKLRIDINEQVVAEILMRHLLPRFRALLEGSIK